MIFRQKDDGEWEFGPSLDSGIVLNFGFNFKDEALFAGIPVEVAAKAFADEARKYADQMDAIAAGAAVKVPTAAPASDAEDYAGAEDKPKRGKKAKKKD